MKKLISLTLVLMLLVSLSIGVLAAPPADGTITINGVSAGTTYEIYRLLDLESYNTATGVYAYLINPAWTGFFALPEVLNYVKIEDGYVTWKAANDDDTVAAFAKMALKYAQDNSIAPVKSSENPGDFVITGTSGKFSDLVLGYYLVDSNVGALCGLTTTNPNASVNAKNGSPTLDKQVKEDSTNQWGDSSSADIGQTIEFRITINVHAGAQNYVLHDILSTGLDFTGVSHIEHVIPDVSTTVVPNTMYEVVTDPALLTDGCTFEVRFSQDFCDHLETNDKVIVYYSGTLNKNAVVAGGGNANDSWLSYGEDHHVTANDNTKTFTFAFDLVKTDSQNTLISGAQFTIYDAATGGNEIAVVPMEGQDGVYRRAKAGEEGVAINVTGGKVRVLGFDNGTYYLEETVNPDGYNKLTSRVKFIIADGNLDAVFNDGVFSSGSGVHVVNKSGSMLPETGAMGTALFIAGGMFVVLAAGVLLVTKKRMGMIQD